MGVCTLNKYLRYKYDDMIVIYVFFCVCFGKILLYFSEIIKEGYGVIQQNTWTPVGG